MPISNYHLELSGPQTGLSLYDEEYYIGTYRSANDCLMDLAYRVKASELDKIVEQFARAANCQVNEPYIYRGVCSELYWPNDKIYRYVYYENTLSALLEHFDYHESRAAKYDDIFQYGVQGTAIHLFDPAEHQYVYWIGGNLKSVEDVMNEVKRSHLTIPTALQEEYSLIDKVDVFISHKNEDYSMAKKVYDLLDSHGYRVFLSEVTLPAVSNADYTSEIDKALDSADHLILIADRTDKINSGWVKYEWNSFLNEKRSGRKTGNLVTLLSDNIQIGDLPYALRQMEVIQFSDMERILNYVN